MASKDDSALKTEKPTPKRLRDARIKEGQVSKSKDLTSTVALLAWLVLFWLMMPLIYGQLVAVSDLALGSIGKPFSDVVWQVLQAGLSAFVTVTLSLVVVAACAAVAAELVQVGGLYATKRVTPDLNRINAAEGVKRMFSEENVVEVIKSFFKTAAIVGICTLVLFGQLDSLLKLPSAGPAAAVGLAFWEYVQVVGIIVIMVFAMISVLDVAYQRFALLKRLRMTRQEIKRELKDTEGDPFVKARRRQLHTEWAQRNIVQAVKTSNVLVTNPTHLAVALTYEPDETVVPVVSAKGEDHVARMMVDAAEEASVPVMRNIDLARGLYRAEIDEYVPVEYFEAVAEVLSWADSVRKNQFQANR